MGHDLDKQTTLPWEPLGDALLDYQNGNYMAHLFIKSSVELDRSVPVEVFFRSKKLPPVESLAIRLCRGKVLDAGAGAGSHALKLQEKGLEVTALDISEGAGEVMRKRGIKKVICSSIFDCREKGFDTILLLMNGIGIAGDIPGLHRLLAHLGSLLKEDGQIIFDSTDISYVNDASRAKATLKVRPPYYGMVQYQLSYKGKQGAPYYWLFADEELIKEAAQATGFSCRVASRVSEQFLCVLQKVKHRQTIREFL